MAAAAAPRQGSSDKLVKQTTLKQLLDGLVIAQKNDIQAFSKGHLNESNLPKPPNKAGHNSWRSATKPHIQLVPRSSIPATRRNLSNERAMKNTMWNFSIGTSGTAYMSGKPKPTPVSKPPTVLSGKTRRSTSSQKSAKSDGILIEELKLPEAMLVTTEYPDPKSKLNSSGRELTSRELNTSLPTFHDMNPPRTQERSLPTLKHTFVSGHLEAVTKKDQLVRMREFEEVILRKQDATEQNVMTGIKAVAHIEAKLQQDLDGLSQHGYGINFHRLQIFSNILYEFIKDSATFGFMLQTIKNEYDGYISHLMDSQMSKHQTLYEQVQQLTSRDKNSETLRHEVANVNYMEGEAKKLLDENERLRKELDHEKYLQTKPVVEDKSANEVGNYREEHHDLLDTVEELKAHILEKLDLMNALKTKLRLEYVPSTVCSHLEQCIKETEVETQKLTSQKEFLDRNITDMEKDLQNAIETADTTEKDARRVWKRVTAVKAVDRSALHGMPGAGITTTGPGGAAPNPYHDSDDEHDDDKKWSWYIS